MDPELSQQAKDFLERYRKAESLGTDARARMLSGLRAKMSVGPTIGGPGGALRPALAKLVAAGKTKILLGVLAVMVPAAWTLHQSKRSVDYTLRTATPDVPAAPNVAPQPAPVAAPSSLDDEPYASASATQAVPFESLPEAVPTPARVQPKRAGSPERAVPSEPKIENAASESSDESKSTTPATAAADPDSTLDQEMLLLKRAHVAEKAGRPSEALSILAEHARRFPNGKLSESREVAKVILLCESGQTRASHAAAERFLAARPNSPFASRVKAACAPSEKSR